MQFAIIDCGTNTFHLMIAEKKSSGETKVIYKTKTVVKLGEGGILSNTILPVPFERGLNALGGFRKTIDDHQVKNITAYGTAALRNAKNGKDFIHEAWVRHQIKPDLITGSREAELIYKGVCMAVPFEKGISLIMDIGGGSTEFILCNEKDILWKKSFKAGAALMLEKFHPSDPLSVSELKSINKWHQEIFQPLLEAVKNYPPNRLIGSSGSFDTFAEMILYQMDGNINKLRNRTDYHFRMSDYRSVHKQLLFSTTAERKKMKGLIMMRVDMIVMSSLQLNFIVRNLKLKKMILSRYALKEGILSELSAKRKLTKSKI